MNDTLVMDTPDLTEERWEHDPAGHTDEVIAWRKQEFEKLKFPEYLASHLAQSDVNLRKLEKMLGQGCDPELALDIFFGGRES